MKLIRFILLACIALLGTGERDWSRGKDPVAMPPKKGKSSHDDAKRQGLSTEEVGKLRKMKMKGERGKRPKANAFDKVPEGTYEKLKPKEIYTKILPGKWQISEQPLQSPDAKWRKVDRWQATIDENKK